MLPGRKKIEICSYTWEQRSVFPLAESRRTRHLGIRHKERERSRWFPAGSQNPGDSFTVGKRSHRRSRPERTPTRRGLPQRTSILPVVMMRRLVSPFMLQQQRHRGQSKYLFNTLNLGLACWCFQGHCICIVITFSSLFCRTHFLQ